jgi:isoquinoline 1-oxidoreductase beta subunit
LRLEPPGIPTAFWRSVGPSHNVFVIKSFMDELAAAAGQDAVAYRRALLDKSPRAKAVLELAADKAGWGRPLPERTGRGVSVQFVFGTYMAQVAEVEVSKTGVVRVRRVVCAVDCGVVVNPDTVRAQIAGAIVFGVTAALYGEITLKDGVSNKPIRYYQVLRMDQAPTVEVHIIQSPESPGGMGDPGTSRTCSHQRDICSDRQALAKAADRSLAAEGDLPLLGHADHFSFEPATMSEPLKVTNVKALAEAKQVSRWKSSSERGP